MLERDKHSSYLFPGARDSEVSFFDNNSNEICTTLLAENFPQNWTEGPKFYGSTWSPLVFSAILLLFAPLVYYCSVIPV